MRHDGTPTHDTVTQLIGVIQGVLREMAGRRPGPVDGPAVELTPCRAPLA